MDQRIFKRKIYNMILKWKEEKHYYEKYSKVIARRYLVYTKDLQKDGNILLLPIYITPFI